MNKDFIAARKADHIRICLEEDVAYKNIRTGFEKIQLTHCALPELNFNDINSEISFLNKTLAFPLMISSMTGGFDGATRFNQQLAEVCQEQQIALGLGSLRPAIDNSDLLDTFRIVNKTAGRIPVIGNIGAAQIISQAQRLALQRILDKIELDALAVHLNPLQEILQPEGDLNFAGVLKGLEKLVKLLTIPIIIKETGAGISGKVARQLQSAGITIIDVSGAGGTSWAAVEHYRSPNKALTKRFWDWGIPTVTCLEEMKQIGGLQIIASGGIRSGLDCAKACVLGASLSGAATPFLKILHHSDVSGLNQYIQDWRKEFMISMFLTGCQQVSDLPEVTYQIVSA